jgi:hypothetical protein
MDFASVIAWLQENGTEIVAVLLAAHALAVAVVNLTPTPKDDEIVGKVYKVIEFVAGIFTRKAKELPGEAKFAEDETKAGA